MPSVGLEPSQGSLRQGKDMALIRRRPGLPTWDKPTTADTAPPLAFGPLQILHFWSLGAVRPKSVSRWGSRQYTSHGKDAISDPGLSRSNLCSGACAAPRVLSPQHSSHRLWVRGVPPSCRISTCLLAEMLQSGAQWITGDTQQPLKRPVPLQDQEDRPCHRERTDEQDRDDGGVGGRQEAKAAEERG